MKSRLASLPLVELLLLGGCWTTAPVAPSSAPVSVRAQRPPESCARAGDQLVIEVCRRDDDLHWTLTNATDHALWAFVAPPAGPIGAFDRAHASAELTHGRLLLTKLQPDPFGGEAHPTGAVRLEPGGSDRGVIQVGRRFVGDADQWTGVRIDGTTQIRTVALRVGFTEVLATDAAHAAERFVIVMSVGRARQVLVRSPDLPW